METTYAGSTIWQAYITMGTLFKSAVMNDIKYLTIDEQEFRVSA